MGRPAWCSDKCPIRGNTVNQPASVPVDQLRRSHGALHWRDKIRGYHASRTGLPVKGSRKEATRNDAQGEVFLPLAHFSVSDMSLVLLNGVSDLRCICFGRRPRLPAKRI